MIPKAYLTDEIVALNRFLDGQPVEILANYPPPTPHDFATFGAIIQTYNYIELNLRRAISAFKTGGVLRKDLSAGSDRLSGDRLIEAVKGTVAAIHAETGLDGEAQGHLDAIQRHQPIRNLLAHWAARRMPGKDYLVLLGKDNRDARQALGSRLEADEAARCVVQASALTGLVSVLAPHEEWLAKKVASWHSRYVEGGT